MGRLAGNRYLGSGRTDGVATGNAPAGPWYACPSGKRDSDPSTSAATRGNYVYNVHMRVASIAAEPVLYCAELRISKHSKVPAGTKSYNSITGAVGGEDDPNVSRALVVDPNIGVLGSAYATHAVGNTFSFNLGYADGSVRTAHVRNTMTLPITGTSTLDRRQGRQVIAALQYLEAVVDTNTDGRPFAYVTSGVHAGIPYLSHYP